MSFRPRPSGSSRTLLRSLGEMCRPHLETGARQTKADHYVKEYDSAGFGMAFVCFMLLRLSSLRELDTSLQDDQQVRRAVGWDGNISISQLIKLQHRRPPALWEPLVAALMTRLGKHQMPSRLRVMDTSFFTMGLKLLSRHHEKKMTASTAGFKLGLVLDPECGTPLRLCSNVGQGTDTAQLDALVPPDQEDIAGLIFLFDRGFRKYKFFDSLIQREAHFVTRATAMVKYKVLEELPLDPQHPQITADWVVRLGSSNGHNLMKHTVRMIRLETDTETFVFLSSLGDLTAWEVTEVYRRRWEIEVFFRWLKRAVGCLKPTGYSLTAAQHCFYAALVVYLITLLIAKTELNRKTGRIRRCITPALHRLRANLYQVPKDEDLQALEFL